MKVLHISPGLQWGGVENWICRIAPECSARNYEIAILAPEDKVDESYIKSVVRNQFPVVRAPSLSKPMRFFAAVHQTLRSLGPFEVMHAHMCASNAPLVAIARANGVPVTVAHSHIDLRGQRMQTLQRAYRALAKPLLSRLPSCRMACSAAAATSEFGVQSGRNNAIILCGLDYEALTAPPRSMGAELDEISASNSIVVAHIGRMTEQKNHLFLLDIFAAAYKQEPRLLLLLIGGGPLQEAIRSRVAALGLENQVKMMGSRSDAYEILLNVADCFLFPSSYEGLGVALLEAQAAGLPCVVSEKIPAGAIVMPSLVRRLTLSDPIWEWAAALLAACKQGKHPHRPLVNCLEGAGLTSRQNAITVVNEYRKLHSKDAPAKTRPGLKAS